MKEFFSGRINRKNYFLGMTIFIGIFLIIYWICTTYFQNVPVLFIIILAGFVWIFTTAIKIRRIHDAGYSGWFVLLACIPYLNFIFEIILLVIPGDTGNNKYGVPPKTRPSIKESFMLS